MASLFIITLIVTGFFSATAVTTVSNADYKKVCIGTSNRMSYSNPASTNERYKNLKDRYTGCVYVDGNLEIAHLDDKEYNLAFLKTIEEVTGYVLIFSVRADRIPLTSLKIVRGRSLFTAYDYTDSDSKPLLNTTRSYSLYVAFNDIFQLRALNLTEISSGSVLFHSNHHLCFVNTIDWKDILSGEGAKTIIHSSENQSNDDCDSCSVNCSKGNSVGKRHCWAKHVCQIFTLISCAQQCSGRCFGKDANQCCHQECAAGCYGPTNTECFACKNFMNDEHCEPFCPQESIYDTTAKINIPNPNAKYTYGSQCVKKCPPHMMISKGACVSDCGKDHYADKDGKCVESKCDHCPKSCQGTGDHDFLHTNNSEGFVNCTKIQGSLKIQETTFTGDAERNIPALPMERLSVLENVVEITDYLRVDASFEKLKNLSFLKNLKVIQGRNLDKGVTSLMIQSTNLERLDLNSLTQITHGKVSIVYNKNLCFVENFNWLSLMSVQLSKTIDIRNNRNTSYCEADGLVCSAECTSDGCMGPDDDQCRACTNYRYGSKCLPSCGKHQQPHLTTINGSIECQPCHAECLGSCHGPNNDDCKECLNVRFSDRCLATCPPDNNYYINETRHCRSCNSLCVDGCNGSDHFLGSGGCLSCHNVKFHDNGRAECLLPGVTCSKGYYNDTSVSSPDRPNGLKGGCRKCYDLCEECIGEGINRPKCTECTDFREEDKCVKSCSADYYSSGIKQCHRCHEECLECTGPTASDCRSCRLYILYEDYGKRHINLLKFNCTNSCPEFAANKLRDGNGTFCVSDEYAKPDGKKLATIIAGTICGGVFLIGLIVILSLILRRQVARTEEKKLRLTAQISGVVECEPLTPSTAKPDMAVLRLIKESDLRKSNIIGSGAFGTVYKGFWIPEGENVKIPVAIKVLQEQGSDHNQNLLEEARIMASVVHPCCLHVLAVCMTEQMMLITQLMPLGCLLDYVRKHRNNIGSKALLNWSTQIARGMGYLEERGIIHRDLAARNVLVHNPSHVKITDFGLAKLVNEDGEFLSMGGKLPIKWLALECIRHRIFTHKSDVWSFGVTIWELCTYGQRPYETISATDILNLLEKGERLPQPSICTIDVYMIMIKCWMLDAQSRPSFSELAEEFAKMARDPGRYLVINNDRLMRLPSQPVDPREILRNVSLVLDGPEEVIMADEYVNDLAKRARMKRTEKIHGRHQTMDNDEVIVTGSKHGVASSSAAVQPSSGSKRQMRLVPRLELATQNRLSATTTTSGDESPRYSPDPCSFSYQTAFPGTADVAIDKTRMSSSSNSEDPSSLAVQPPLSPFTNMKPPPPWTTTGEKRRLPLDGTDYLQPQSSLPVSYLELTEYKSTDDSTREKEEEEEENKFDYKSQKEIHLPDESTSLLQKPSTVENPEYFQPTNTTPLLAGHVH